MESVRLKARVRDPNGYVELFRRVRPMLPADFMTTLSCKMADFILKLSWEMSKFE